MNPATRHKWIAGLPECVTPSERLILFVLDTHAYHETGTCYPSTAKLCAETQLSERTVRAGIGGLEQMGLISVDRPPGRRSTYTINWGSEPAIEGEEEAPKGNEPRQPLQGSSEATPATIAGVPRQPLQDTPATIAGVHSKDPEQKTEQKQEGLTPAAADARPPGPAPRPTASPSAGETDNGQPAEAPPATDPPSPPPLPLRTSGGQDAPEPNGNGHARAVPKLRMATPEEQAARLEAEAQARRHLRDQLLPRLSGVLSFADPLPRPVLDTLPLPQDERAWQACTGRHAGPHGEGDPHGLLPKLRWHDPKQPVDWRRILRVLADRGAYRLWHSRMRQAVAGEKPPSWETAMQMAHQARGRLDAQRNQLVEQAESDARYAEVQAMQEAAAREREAEREQRRADYEARHAGDQTADQHPAEDGRG